MFLLPLCNLTTWDTWVVNIGADALGCIHLNCKTHLKENTKVNAEYNLPTGFPTLRVNMTKRRIPGICRLPCSPRVNHVPSTMSSPHHKDNRSGLCSEPVGGETVRVFACGEWTLNLSCWGQLCQRRASLSLLAWQQDIYSIFSVSDILVTSTIYSQYLTYWSHIQKILSAWHPIGHLSRIFSVSHILLVTSTEYSQCLTFYWSDVRTLLLGPWTTWPRELDGAQSPWRWYPSLLWTEFCWHILLSAALRWKLTKRKMPHLSMKLTNLCSYTK
jgi:hypothetical protein